MRWEVAGAVQPSAQGRLSLPLCFLTKAVQAGSLCTGQGSKAGCE